MIQIPAIKTKLDVEVRRTYRIKIAAEDLEEFLRYRLRVMGYEVPSDADSRIEPWGCEIAWDEKEVSGT